MTEIPEHLLKRSKERRQSLSGDGTPATSESTEVAKSAPTAPAKAAAPIAPSAPPPPPPDPAYVVAAKERQKIPFWAMAALSLLPLWAFIYFLALQPKEEVVEGPMAIGEAVYGSCAGCHGAAGQGGAGRVLHQGEAMKTFPQIEDMLNFVYTGSQAFVAADIPIYGDPNREGGAHVPLSYNGNPMPQQGSLAGGALTDYEILGVVCHIRYNITGTDPADEAWAAEYANWCSPDSPIFLALQAGTSTFDSIAEDFASLMPTPVQVGTTPRASASK